MSAKKTECKIIKHIGTLKNGMYAKEIYIISWNGNEPVYDIRAYCINKNGTKTTLKGITLNFEEIRMLKDILNTELEEI